MEEKLMWGHRREVGAGNGGEEGGGNWSVCKINAKIFN